MNNDPSPMEIVPMPRRIQSIDALRGAVMFTMIFVNDLAGSPASIVPAWMRHFHGKSGMTFVDLVFPAFLFIVGMSLPLALGSRLAKGESLGKIALHILSRTAGLLLIGIMMVNESPDARAMGWSPTLWSTLMYAASILAFCTISTPAPKGEAGKSGWRWLNLALQRFGFALLAFLALAFSNANGGGIITFSPFSIHTEWYGILGLIGWAYLMGSIVFLCFRNNQTALLGSAVLLMCLYPAERTGAFDHFWLAHYVGLGSTLGSQAAITVAGMLLGSMLLDTQISTPRARMRFTLLFVAGFSAAALLVHGLYGIYKNSATPSWCLWSCAITGALWLVFYYLCDVCPPSRAARMLAAAGSNVLLAYLLSEMLPSALELVGIGNWYGHLGDVNLAGAVARSAACGVVILLAATGLNRAGFRLKL